MHIHELVRMGRSWHTLHGECHHYFASYIITNVFEDKLVEANKELDDKFKVSKTEMQKEIQREVNELTIKKAA